MTTAFYIRTGALKHYADMQIESNIADGGGGYSAGWETERKLWCQIKPLTGLQQEEAMQRQSKVTHTIYARYQNDTDPEIMPTKRIRYGGKVYKILAAWSPLEWPEFVVMSAVSGTST